MTQCVFYLDNAKQQRLSATWNQNWEGFRLFFEGEEVCSFATKKELVSGRQFVMPDGHLLSVRLKTGFYPRVELLRDNLPLPYESKHDPGHLKTVSQLALFLGVLNMAAGAAAELLESDILLSIGFGYGSAALGAVYIWLAWGIRRLPSFAVLAIIALLTLDLALVFVFTSLRDGPTSPVSGGLIKLFLVYAFVRGAGVMKQLGSQAAATFV